MNYASTKMQRDLLEDRVDTDWKFMVRQASTLAVHSKGISSHLHGRTGQHAIVGRRTALLHLCRLRWLPAIFQCVSW